MMGTLHTFPGRAPAIRAVSGHLATEEQRRAAMGLLGDTCPEDILWMAPGTPARQAQEIEVKAPQTWRAVPADRSDRLTLLAVIAIAAVCGFIVGELAALAQIVGRL